MNMLQRLIKNNGWHWGQQILTALLLSIGMALIATPAYAVTFTVDSIADDADANPGDGICATALGDCTLRAAIREANDTPNVGGPDEVFFNIPGTGPHRIQPTSSLGLTEPTIIDGYTQSGASPNTLAVGSDAVILIELEFSSSSGFQFDTGNTLRGITCVRATLRCVQLIGANNIVAGNFLGMDSIGTTGSTPFDNGISISAASSNNTIGGTTPDGRNVMGNATNSAIFLEGPSNTVQGNYIGVDPSGTLSRLNVGGGIFVRSANNQIGGSNAGEGNLIANSQEGIDIRNGGSNGNVIQGNTITGSTSHGIDLELNVSLNTIGGSAAGAGNTITGGSMGIRVAQNSNNNTVQSNVISDSSFGIALHADSDSNIVGGSTAGEGNTITSAPASGTYANTATFAALLTSDGTPLANEPIVFGLGSQSLRVPTNGSGEATATFILVDTPGALSLEVSYPGATSSQPSAASSPFVINKQVTNLGVTTVQNPDTVAIATLTDASNNPLREETIVYIVEDAATNAVVLSVAKITNYLGQTALNLTLPNLSEGNYNVSAYFGGNAPVICPKPKGKGILDFSNYMTIVEAGYETALEPLRQWREAQGSIILADSDSQGCM